MQNNHNQDGIQYWTHGDPKKQSLLLVHGFTGSHDGFQYLVPLLEKQFFLIVPDLPGFGISAPAKQPWTVDSIAAQTNSFVRALKLKQKPIVVSHSMGGLITASMLTQNPELFDTKTIFISPVATRIGWLDGRKAGALAGQFQYALGHHVPKFGDSIVKSKKFSRVATFAIMTTKDKSLQKTIYQHHFDNLDHISSSKYYHDLQVDITKRGVINFTDGLARYDVAIISGNKDNVTPLKGVKLLAASLDAKLTIVENVGHLAHYEKPNELANAIISFLK